MPNKNTLFFFTGYQQYHLDNQTSPSHKHHTASNCLTKEKITARKGNAFYDPRVAFQVVQCNDQCSLISIDQILQLNRIIRTVLRSRQTSSTQQGYFADDPL